MLKRKGVDNRPTDEIIMKCTNLTAIKNFISSILEKRAINNMV
ncbi:hypothetical protein [Oceanobacillus sp. CAU 1775]